MIVFLEKVRVRTAFSVLEPIVTEPLELMYLEAILSEEGILSYLIDTKFKKEPPKGVVPDLIVLNGYNVSESQMISQSRYYKKTYPFTKVMVSGVHAQVNRKTFRVEGIDYVFFSQSLETFRRFIKGDTLQKGWDAYQPFERKWRLGDEDRLFKNENIEPERRFFYEIKSKTRYIDKKEVAIVKGGHGCPFECVFCYCRLLNDGVYIKPDYDRLMSQIRQIDTHFIWLVDDSFFITSEDALLFIEKIKQYEIKKSFIMYTRADFIIMNQDLLVALKDCGVDEVIVGFETPDGKTLERYKKGLNEKVNEKAVEITKKARIDLTALFIVDPDYQIKDFIKLSHYIKALDLSVYTLSIMTPLRGTEDYEKKKHLLTETDSRYFDFLHLVLPSKLPKMIFYLLFYTSHIRLLKSKRIRKMLRGIFWEK